jgi:hypothetical protein
MNDPQDPQQNIPPQNHDGDRPQDEGRGWTSPEAVPSRDEYGTDVPPGASAQPSASAPSGAHAQQGVPSASGAAAHPGSPQAYGVPVHAAPAYGAPAGGGAPPLPPRPPKGPTSASGGPAEPVAVTRGGRIAARTLIAVVAVLALAVPTAAIGAGAYFQLNQTTIEHSADLPAEAASLRVEASDAAVYVQVDDEAEVPRVESRYEGRKRDIPAPVVTEDGDRTVVDVPMPDGPTTWLQGYAEITVTLPGAYAEGLDLDVATSTGMVDVSGEYTSVTAKTETGAVTADVITGTADLSAGTGAVDVWGGSMDVLQVSTRTGAISVNDARVNSLLKAQTRSGWIDLGLDPAGVPVDGVEVAAKSGAVTVEVPLEQEIADPDITGYSVSAQTQVGRSRVEIAQRQPGEGILPLTVSTSSGEIAVEYTDGEYDADGSGWDEEWDDSGWDEQPGGPWDDGDRQRGPGPGDESRDGGPGAHEDHGRGPGADREGDSEEAPDAGSGSRADAAEDEAPAQT